MFSASDITDRAKRYRANSKALRPPDPKQCGFCGSKRNVGVHHINGREADLDKQNLMWACKSCNTRLGIWMKRAGYAAAIRVMRGEFEGDLSKAVSVIRATPREIRSAYTSRTWPTRRAIYGPSGRAQGQLFS